MSGATSPSAVATLVESFNVDSETTKAVDKLKTFADDNGCNIGDVCTKGEALWFHGHVARSAIYFNACKAKAEGAGEYSNANMVDDVSKDTRALNKLLGGSDKMKEYVPAALLARFNRIVMDAK